MSVTITWPASQIADIESYQVEKARAAGGPWLTYALVPHAIPGPDWDGVRNVFRLVDASGNAGSYYRIRTVDANGFRTTHLAPFRAGAEDPPPPPLVNMISIVVGNVSTLLNLGYRNIEVWRSHDDGGTWAEATVGGRLELAESVAVYQFYDTAGEQGTRYRWRFSDNGATPISPFSKYVMARAQPLTSPETISVGTAHFIGIDGAPLRRKIIVSMENAPSRVGQYIAGDDNSYVVESDESGFLQVPLLRGMTVQVALEGTSVVHRLVVPNAPTFDIFSVGEEVPDRFAVQSLPPRLTRRTIS